MPHLLDELKVAPGSPPSLAERDPDQRLGARSKDEGLERLEQLRHRSIVAESTLTLLFEVLTLESRV